MQKDVVPKAMEPFTSEEEKGLVAKLDGLSAASLESYVTSARNSLGNNALAATWRPRIEFAVRHAEQALVKAQAAAALAELNPPVAAAPSPRAKKAVVAAAVEDDADEAVAEE